jgi:sugar O-acyltransferase (sialic acid O-acetyltransferase NeuD family)
MVTLKQVVIIGAGGFAREVLDVFDAVNAITPTYEVLGFVVDQQYGKPGEIINAKPILGGFDWLEKHKGIHTVCGVGAPEHRLQLIRRAAEAGSTFCSIVHPNVILTRWIEIGEGTVITAGCILTNQIKIGNHVHINLDSTIGHDVVIEDYVTISPGAHISGNIVLKEGSYIGTGANIIEKKVIGNWSVVGAGSTVTKDVPDNSTVVGIPARVIKTREVGWQLQ